MNERLDAYEERRRLDATRKLRRGRRDPAVQAGHRAARQAKVAGLPCRQCGAMFEIEGHHIVPRSKFGARDKSVHDENNLIPLCHLCHQNHHTTADKRIPRHLLAFDELTFAIAKGGQRWFNMWYPERPSS